MEEGHWGGKRPLRTLTTTKKRGGGEEEEEEEEEMIYKYVKLQQSTRKSSPFSCVCVYVYVCVCVRAGGRARKHINFLSLGFYDL